MVSTHYNSDLVVPLMSFALVFYKIYKGSIKGAHVVINTLTFKIKLKLDPALGN